MMRIVLSVVSVAAVAGFAPSLQQTRANTRVFVSPRIIDMIEKEYLREQKTFEEREREFHEKNDKYLDPVFPEGFEAEEIEDFLDRSETDMRAHITGHSSPARDRRMAATNPSRYCADRCISTGHCEVFEDMFDLSAEEVRQFCEDCVMSEDTEACDIPEGFKAKSI